MEEEGEEEARQLDRRGRKLQVDLLLNMDRYRLESEESW